MSEARKAAARAAERVAKFEARTVRYRVSAGERAEVRAARLGAGEWRRVSLVGSIRRFVHVRHS